MSNTIYRCEHRGAPHHKAENGVCRHPSNIEEKFDGHRGTYHFFVKDINYCEKMNKDNKCEYWKDLFR